MKPLLILFTCLAAFFAQPSFATEKDITPSSVLKSFNEVFSAATEVEWTETESLYKARFVLSGQVVNAYYSTDGEMLAVTRNITSHQLPLALQTGLKKGYESYWIADLFELSNEDGTAYYVTLESADQKVVLKSGAAGVWSLYQKSRKN